MTAKYRLISLIVSFIVSAFIIAVHFDTTTRFEEQALGNQTQSYYATKNNKIIHCDSISEFKNIENTWILNGKKSVVFCLGNSQTHAINQLKPTDINYVRMLSDSLDQYNKEVLAVSIPNVCLEEMMLVLDYTYQHFPIEYLTIPVCMDDLREDVITPSFFDKLTNENYQMKDSTVTVVKSVNSMLRTLSMTNTSNSDIAGLNHTPQEKVESYLNHFLERNSMIWRSRPQIRGDFLVSLFFLRNNIFNITAETKRKMIPMRYKANFDALTYMLDKAKERNTKVLLYVPPIRNDAEIPYDAVEYKKFKMDLELLAKKYSNVRFTNVENCVSNQYWGLKDATTIGGKPELDFMHFQYAGHKQLFEKIYPELKSMMKQ
jgi:hypothetical protein